MGYGLDRFRSFYEFNHGYIKLNTLPLIAEVELTNICNLKCGFCNREGIGKRGFGMMPLHYFKAICGLLHKQMVHTRLFLHGESVLHPDLVEMVRFLNLYRGNNVKSIGFTTNGVLLTPYLFKRLVASGLDNLEFSFEGTSKEVYESLRSGAKFEDVKENIFGACNINYDLGSPVNIGINIIDCKQTRSKLSEFIHEWEEVRGLNRVDVGVLGDWAGTYNIDKYRNEGEETFLPICPAPWFTCTIHWNGDVVPCCKWLDKPLGNVMVPQTIPSSWLDKHLPWDNYRGRIAIEEVWNGKGFRDLRRAMKKGRQNHPYCRNCKSNLFSEKSPYLTKPTKFYPFTKGFLNQIMVYRALSGNKKYVPLREKQK